VIVKPRRNEEAQAHIRLSSHRKKKYYTCHVSVLWLVVIIFTGCSMVSFVVIFFILTPTHAQFHLADSCCLILLCCIICLMLNCVFSFSSYVIINTAFARIKPVSSPKARTSQKTQPDKSRRKGNQGATRLSLTSRNYVRGVMLAARPGLYSRERPVTHCTGGWMGLRAGLDGHGKSRSHRDTISVAISRQPPNFRVYFKLPRQEWILYVLASF
jgi:hypothetical protein